MTEIRTRKSSLGWCVLAGTIVLGLIGALIPQPSDLNVVSGAIYGFLLGAIIGVVIDRFGIRVWQSADMGTDPGRETSN